MDIYPDFVINSQQSFSNVKKTFDSFQLKILDLGTTINNKIDDLVQGTQYVAEFKNKKVRDSGVLLQDIMMKNVPSKINNIATLNSVGQVTESAFVIDDTAPPNSKILYSSANLPNKVHTETQASGTNNKLGTNTHEFTFVIPRAGTMICFGTFNVSGPLYQALQCSVRVNGVVKGNFGPIGSSVTNWRFASFNVSADVPAGNVTIGFIPTISSTQIAAFTATIVVF